MSQTETVQTANAEATRLIDSAHAEADRLRGECDIYVDSKLAEFEEFLNGTLRSVGRGRHQLRTAAGTHDYAHALATAAVGRRTRRYGRTDREDGDATRSPARRS